MLMCNLCFFGSFPLQLSLSVLWYCWLGLLTCKNRLPYNLYCVGGDLKHCSIQSNPLSAELIGGRIVLLPNLLAAELTGGRIAWWPNRHAAEPVLHPASVQQILQVPSNTDKSNSNLHHKNTVWDRNWYTQNCTGWSLLEFCCCFESFSDTNFVTVYSRVSLFLTWFMRLICGDLQWLWVICSWFAVICSIQAYPNAETKMWNPKIWKSVRNGE